MTIPRRSARLLALLAFAAGCSSSGPTDVGVTPTPTPTPPITETLVVPSIAREFRGMWVATVANIDWPTSSSLSATQQRTELTTILDLARNTGLNAVVLQVRAKGDAIFPSSLEPWSRSLSGVQGTDPGWDPLAFAVSEAHARGLELHAWFNPFRAASLSEVNQLSAMHFAKRRPDLTRDYCTQLWFDPGEAEVQTQALAVVRDVISRYDVDGVHIDDFFYPYPETSCPGLDFPDGATYARYQQGGGTLSRADWRRDNVNRFVQKLYTDVHAQKSHVRVGVSPFGIWRPGNPAGITGLDAYGSIYADSRHWLQQGWVDYFAPQLYWSIASTGQSFPALLDWWVQQNTQRRHLWPGLAAYRTADGTSSAFSSSEIPSQLDLIRGRSATSGGSTGALLYNTTSIRLNRGNLASTLASTTYASAAIPPASTWLDGVAPATPTISVETPSGTTSTLRVRLTSAPSEPLSWWLVRWKRGTTWSQQLVPGSAPTYDISTLGSGGAVSAIVVNAIDRVGNASGDAIWRAP